jgi:hypothetical protein
MTAITKAPAATAIATTARTEVSAEAAAAVLMSAEAAAVTVVSAEAAAAQQTKRTAKTKTTNAK